MHVKTLLSTAALLGYSLAATVEVSSAPAGSYENPISGGQFREVPGDETLERRGVYDMDWVLVSKGWDGNAPEQAIFLIEQPIDGLWRGYVNPGTPYEIAYVTRWPAAGESVKCITNSGINLALYVVNVFPRQIIDRMCCFYDTNHNGPKC